MDTLWFFYPYCINLLSATLPCSWIPYRGKPSWRSATSSCPNMYSPSSVITSGIVLPVLGVLAVVLRFAVRIKSTSMGLGFDDWAMLAACVIVCGMGSLQVVGEYRTTSTENVQDWGVFSRRWDRRARTRWDDNRSWSKSGSGQGQLPPFTRSFFTGSDLYWFDLRFFTSFLSSRSPQMASSRSVYCASIGGSSPRSPLCFEPTSS